MNQWDEEEYYEPTIADDIFEEAKEKLTEALKDSVKQDINKIIKENEFLKKRNKELSDKVINFDRDKIEFERNKSKLLEQATIDLERKMCVGFRPNDIAWMVSSKSTRVKCNVCDGKGKETVKSFGKDVEIRCHNCNGNETVRKYEYFPKQYNVSSVQFYLSCEDYGKTKKTHPKIYLDSYEYSIEEKNISSKLFKTKEECQAKCDEQNKKEEVK